MVAQKETLQISLLFLAKFICGKCFVRLDDRADWHLVTVMWFLLGVSGNIRRALLSVVDVDATTSSASFLATSANNSVVDRSTSLSARSSLSLCSADKNWMAAVESTLRQVPFEMLSVSTRPSNVLLGIESSTGVALSLADDVEAERLNDIRWTIWTQRAIFLRTVASNAAREDLFSF